MKPCSAQLGTARLIAMLRQLDVPLADVRELLACDPADAGKRIAGHWRQAGATHAARRELATCLITRLSGKGSVIMYEVATRQMPERSLPCLKRNVDEQGAWVLGKEFVAILRDRPLPRLAGREGATFCIYWVRSAPAATARSNGASPSRLPGARCSPRSIPN